MSGQRADGGVSEILVLDDHMLSGLLSAELRLSGTTDDPDLAGSVSVADGYYENVTTGTILNDLALRLEAGDDTIRLADFHADDSAGGTLTGDGQIGLDPDSNFPFAFEIKMDEPRLAYRDDLKVQSSGALTLSGDLTRAKLAGDLSVGPAYMVIPERVPEQQVATVDFREKGDVPDDENDGEVASYRIELDVNCELPGRVFVRGPGLDSEWEGELKVGNYANDPALTGVLRVKYGTLEFLGRTFNLAESTIAFDGQTPPSPYLRLLAVAQTNDFTARVRLEGDYQSLASR